MPTISPTITVSSTPGISVTLVGNALTYQAFLNSLGSDNYVIDELYYYSDQLAQFIKSPRWKIYTANGDFAGEQLVTPISPKQFQPALLLNLAERNFIINGFSVFVIDVLPLNMIQFIFYCKRKTVEDVDYNDGHFDNFKEVERAMGIEGFFDDPGGDFPHQIIFVEG